MKKISTIIIGASGYTGAELLRLLLIHPHVEITGLVADSNAGKTVAEIYPHLYGAKLPVLSKLADVDFKKADLVFCCLPHSTSQKIIKELLNKNVNGHLKIIDLSADFRIQDTDLYEKWYGEHFAKDIQSEAVYGLVEIHREKIKKARIIANPGCYPTSALLPLLPLIEAGLIDKKDIIIDSKSGATGAGRSLKQNLLFSEVQDGFSAYGVTGHRHSAEISEQIAASLTFVAHLLPINRGISSSIYVNLKGDVAKAKKILEDKYKNEPFVKVLSGESVPSTHMVRGTNFCFMNIFQGQQPGKATIISVIDNLCKGASGQAVQNMNLLFDLPETTALEMTAIFP
jgi:N-acetyl-gamma-glutamyl-phosphate reductase